MNQFNECQTCGLPSNTLGITIDESATCCYCAFDKENRYDLYNSKRYKRLFESRIETIRGKYEYDALVGVSGGKDGAYVLHQLVRKYDLKALTYTFDNEFPPAVHLVERPSEIWKVLHVAGLSQIVDEISVYGPVKENFLNQRSVKTIFQFPYLKHFHDFIYDWPRLSV